MYNFCAFLRGYTNLFHIKLKKNFDSYKWPVALKLRGCFYIFATSYKRSYEYPVKIIIFNRITIKTLNLK